MEYAVNAESSMNIKWKQCHPSLECKVTQIRNTIKKLFGEGGHLEACFLNRTIRKLRAVEIYVCDLKKKIRALKVFFITW